MFDVNKYGEFAATVENIEELLREGAEYEATDSPQICENLIRWNRIDNELTSRLNLNNIPMITSGDTFILNGEKFSPVKARNVYKADWDKNHTTQVKLKLNENTDRDIIEYLDSLPNKQGRIKELIRNDIKASN